MQDIFEIENRLKQFFMEKAENSLNQEYMCKYKNRYSHCIKAEMIAKELSVHFKLSIEECQKAMIAALLHDCGKEYPKKEGHAKRGKKIAQSEFDITDKTVLRAIRRHQNKDKHPCETVIDWIVHCADCAAKEESYDIQKITSYIKTKL
ncbi:MAG: HD domain-containing protein [Oscillospiraceae bacterium]|jgi:HD superfamily phosphohydrolase YqeK|nr:HD domain-containing protein [Oscillospiraceae bacterium]